MNLLDIIKHLVITEKSMLAMDDKKYTSETDTRTSKALVRQTVGATFSARVKNVNIVSVHARSRRMDRYVGHTEKRHKVIVALIEDSKEIQLSEAAE